MITQPLKELEKQLQDAHKNLAAHSVYSLVKDVNTLQIFMKSHVFAVWDFMSLLKSLQREITCVTLPWKPSQYPKEVVRMINEIVLGEESDLDYEGRPMDHFSMYIEAMKEVGLDTKFVFDFIEELDFSLLTPAVRNFVRYNLDLAVSGKPHEVAAAFFYGREKLIPDMFTSIVEEFKKAKVNTPALEYYFVRHIELDGGEHSHLAQACLESLCADDQNKYSEALKAGLKSLELRHALWDEVKDFILIQNKLRLS